MKRLVLLGALLGATLSPARAQEPSLFPFVLPWDDASPGVTDLSGSLNKPAGRDGFVTVKDGHLHVGSKRLRLFGVNLAFGANFPRHDDAGKVAARLAKFGINAVRFHHMDMQASPGGLLAADKRALDPDQLDRLDDFVAQLKERGIYSDLNLHVSRTYPDQPTWEGMPSFHKGVDNFFPPMIDWQRRYARDLLLHRNPYTKTRYVDEPAVALVEINNENALLHEWWTGQLDDMPSPYRDDLARRWNDWLAGRYADDAALRRAWGASDTPLGGEALANARFADGLKGWILETHAGAEATAALSTNAEDGPPSLGIAVRKPGAQGWHVQLVQAKLAFPEGQPWTLQFRARADEPTTLTVGASQAHDPWRALWSGTARLSRDWQTFRFTFVPGEAEKDGRITFSGLGTRAGGTWIQGPSLRPGGRFGLRPGEQLGRIDLFRKGDLSGRTPEAQRDWIRFLWDLEDRYWGGMDRFLKRDLGVRVPVVGTQMGWSPFPIQAKLDAIDSHAYWQHPVFPPGKSWSPVDWTVKNVPMAGVPGGGTLPRLGLSRVAGKPFLCTEYNHSAPNTYGSEALPLIAAYAAMQDWDGVFAFAYSHRRDDWDTRKIAGFFEIDQHPTKMATVPAAVSMFVRGDVPPPAGARVASATLAEVIERVRRAGPSVGADAFGIDREEALRVPVAISLEPPAPAGPAAARGTSPLRWEPGAVTIDSPRSKARIGSVVAGRSFRLGDVTVTPGPTRQDWMALTLTAVDGPDLRSAGRILVTATGYAENTEMGWKDAARTSVGRDWGRAPSLVEGIRATIALPVSPAGVRAWALDERGGRKASLAVEVKGERATIELGPEHRTLWYEVAIGPASGRPER